MKKLLLIATGGTIASEKSENGLRPTTSPNLFLDYIAEAKDIAHIDVIEVFNIDSTNILPKHWLIIKDAIKENYDKYDGFIVTHGTDTLSYTAAALSYLIQNANKAIILTGSQKPITDTITDAKKNLLDSIRLASTNGISGVYVVFDGKAILGTRAKKFKSKSYDAFESINYPVAAFIDGSRVLRYVDGLDIKSTPKFYDSLNHRVFLLKLFPGIDPSILDYLSNYYDAIIIESYGVGGVPFNEEKNFKETLKRLTKSGKIIVISTQVMLEGSDALVYEVGYDIIKNYNVLQAYDMTVEAALVKLMWILSITNDFDKIKELFYKVVSKDILL